MILQNVFEKTQSVFSKLPFNSLDFVSVILYVIYVFQEAEFGLISAFLNFSAVIISFFGGLALYSTISRILMDNFQLTKGFADALGFIVVVLVLVILLSLVFKSLRKSMPQKFLPKKLDFIGGFILGTMSFIFLYSFVISLLLSFPISKVIKDQVSNSFSGQTFLVRTNIMESNIRRVFGGAIEDALNFLTIKPDSNQTVKLNFKYENGTVDNDSEKKMLDMINEEREKVGLSPLTQDEKLTDVARKHAQDMLEKGYFSHYSLDGYSPFDRLEQAGISYTFAAENLAFAPDISIAMQGLMKSQGHRENILSKNAQKIGVGVIDAGIFGKMFVQEFTD